MQMENSLCGTWLNTQLLCGWTVTVLLSGVSILCLTRPPGFLLHGVQSLVLELAQPTTVSTTYLENPDLLRRSLFSCWNLGVSLFWDIFILSEFKIIWKNICHLWEKTNSWSKKYIRKELRKLKKCNKGGRTDGHSLVFIVIFGIIILYPVRSVL